MIEHFLRRTPIHQIGCESCYTCSAVAHSFFPWLNAASVAALSGGVTYLASADGSMS